MNMSSELIHSLLPVYMVTVLGASLLLVGIIEGFAEATALFTQMFSGVLSDYWSKCKLLTVIGYGMAAVTKPLFPLASSLATVFLARFLDRVGKGIRGAPRDSLIGELASPNLRGTCYGLRQSLDTVGAFLGPLMAMRLMVLLANEIQAVCGLPSSPRYWPWSILLSVSRSFNPFILREGLEGTFGWVICRGLVGPNGGLYCSEGYYPLPSIAKRSLFYGPNMSGYR